MSDSIKRHLASARLALEKQQTWRSRSQHPIVPGAPLSARLSPPQVWGIVLLVPYCWCSLAFVVYPVGYGLWLARQPASYVALFHDPIFARAAVNTLIFLVIGINIKMLIALFLSGFFVQQRAWIKWLSVLFILPWAVPSIPTILSVRFMLNPEWGMVNQLIFKFTGEDGPNWLNDPTVALTMAIGVHIWKSLPFWTLILMTGRLADLADLFEAADVDGATWWQKFRFITWPSMQTLYITCTLLSMIWTLGDFNSVYLLTGGGPADLTHVLSTLGIRYLRLDQLEPGDGLDRLRDAVRAAAGLFHDETVVAMKLPGLTNSTCASRHRGAAAADRHPRLHLDHDPDLPHVPVRDLAEGGRLLRQAVAGRIRPCTISQIVFHQQHYFLRDFWLQFWNSVVIAAAVGALTLLIATAAAFSISRLRVPGGRMVMNLALFTYFIPAAFLAVPMYRTMGNYGLLNNHWSLILAMVTIASPYAIWVLKQASDKLPVELDEAAVMDGATTLQIFRLVYVPLMMPSLVAIGTYAVLLAWNEYLYAFLLLSNEARSPAGRARQLPRRRRLARGNC